MSSVYYFNLINIKKNRKEALNKIIELAKKHKIYYNPISGCSGFENCPLEKAKEIVKKGGRGYLRFETNYKSHSKKIEKEYVEMRISFSNVLKENYHLLAKKNEGVLRISIAVDDRSITEIIRNEKHPRYKIIVGFIKDLIKNLNPKKFTECWDGEEKFTQNFINKK